MGDSTDEAESVSDNNRRREKKKSRALSVVWQQAINFQKQKSSSDILYGLSIIVHVPECNGNTVHSTKKRTAPNGRYCVHSRENEVLIFSLFDPRLTLKCIQYGYRLFHSTSSNVSLFLHLKQARASTVLPAQVNRSWAQEEIWMLSTFATLKIDIRPGWFRFVRYIDDDKVCKSYRKSLTRIIGKCPSHTPEKFE